MGGLRDRVWKAITAWERACSDVDMMQRAAEVDAAIDALVASASRPLSHESRCGDGGGVMFIEMLKGAYVLIVLVALVVVAWVLP